jgi:prefoldin alpha subunit
MVEEKDIQRKLIKYQILESRANALMKNRESLITEMIEIESTLNSIDEIKKTNEESILLPIGSSVHIKGVLKKADKMIVELGANTAIESTVEKTKEILEKRRKILENGLVSLENELVSLNNEIIKLQPEIRAILEGNKKSSSETAAG